MLRIADYAKRSGIEWYEVLRNVVSNEAPSPVVIPTQGEIAVLRTDENHDIEAYPGAEHINLAYEECELNPVSIARIIHAKFPVIFRFYVTVIPGSGGRQLKQWLIRLKRLRLKRNVAKLATLAGYCTRRTR